MAERSGPLYVLCAKCGYFWVPQKKDKTARYQCPLCGSRATAKATAEEIQDHFKERFRKEAVKEKPRPGRGGICPVCGAKPGAVCRWCKVGFSSFKALTKHIREKHPDKVRPPGGQRKERAEDLSMQEPGEPSIITQARREHLDTAEERRRARGRAADDDDGNPASKPAGRKISADTEQPIHKRIGIRADKLERIVAKWEKAPQRTEIGESGKPLIDEEHNVHWIEVVGGVGWNKAHRIFHEVLMRGAACTLPIGYKPME